MRTAVTTDASRPNTVSASAGHRGGAAPGRAGRGPARRRAASVGRACRNSSCCRRSCRRRPRAANRRKHRCSRPRALRRGYQPGSGPRTPAGPPWSAPGAVPRIPHPDRHSSPGGSWVKTFPTANIRNVALVGHGGAGKTSLAEALLLAAGATPRLGKVEDGTTVCDFDPEEQRRRISVSLALAPFELDGHKVNLLDAPGLRRLHRRRRRRAPGRRPRAVRRLRGRGRRGADRDRVEARRGARHPARDLRQQARPRARVVRAHARPAQGALRRRRRAAAPPDRRGSGSPRRRRAAQRQRGHLRRRCAERAPKARSRPRWRRRSTRSTTRSSRASSSATTT